MVAEPQVPSSIRRRGAQQGMSLIEVLVSLVIFSIGVLGMVGLQARATQLSIDAEDRTRATLLANELVSQMWAAGTTEVNQDVVAAWQRRLADTAAGGLPNAQGVVSGPDGEGMVAIRITWRSPAKLPSDPVSSYVTKVVQP
nr:type IV pilus modification protein PilV [Methylibium rhizosphaerae]